MRAGMRCSRWSGLPAKTISMRGMSMAEWAPCPTPRHRRTQPTGSCWRLRIRPTAQCRRTRGGLTWLRRPLSDAAAGVGREDAKTAAGATSEAAIQQPVTPLSKPLRMRDRDHLRFVSTQPCPACGRIPSDAACAARLWLPGNSAACYHPRRSGVHLGSVR
jgi:hypothetical protein